MSTNRGLSRREFISCSAAFALGVLCCPDLAQASEQTEIAPIITYEPDPLALSRSGRSWYSTTFTLNWSYSTGQQFYDGSSVGIELTSSCDVSDATFEVSLVRNKTSLGTATLRVNRFVRAEWPNVGSGLYHFEFKASAGKPIVCSNVAMFSW